MSGARDAAMMRAFRHECGILCAILTGLMESTQHTRLILDPSSCSDLHYSRLFSSIYTDCKVPWELYAIVQRLHT